MTQERKSFTVSDRRHFTSEGEPREDSEEAANRPAVDAPATPSVPPAADFGPFILSLAAQAGYALAAEGEGEPGEADRKLEDARYLIAIIEMLKVKTEGRRTESEDQIIETVLYELRMGYLARTRAGGA